MRGIRRLLVLALLFIANVGIACELKLGVMDYGPFYRKDNNDEWIGISIDISRTLLTNTGCSLKLVPRPWFRVVHELKTGELDIAGNFSFSDDRQQYAHYIGPVLPEKFILVVPENSDYQINSLDDIKNLSLPIGKGINLYLGDKFETKIAQDPEFAKMFYPVGDSMENPRSYIGNRLSARLEVWDVSMFDQQRGYNFSGLKIHPFIVKETPIYWGFSRKTVDGALLQKIIENHAKNVESNTYQQIWNAHIFGY